MTESGPSCKSCGAWWRLPVLLALVLAAVWLLRDRSAAPPAERSTPAAAAETVTGKKVSLTLDFGDGRRRDLGPISWQQGMTIDDAMRGAAGSALKLGVRGSGEAAFLSEVDGVANDGAAGRYWTYTVNGKAGDRSFAIYELAPGDHVVWTFGTFEEPVK